MPEYIINFGFAALVIIGIVVLWSFFKERLSLEYCVYETDSFSREGGTVNYYNCWITNNGNRELNNVTINISLNGGVIDSVKFINFELLRLNDQKNSSIDATVPLLKPNEKVGALISIKNPEDHSPLKIDARAAGVTARERSFELPAESLRYWGFYR